MKETGILETEIKVEPEAEEDKPEALRTDQLQVEWLTFGFYT